MMQARIVLSVFAIFVLSVACTRPDVTADTQPLAPPDTLTPPTTVTTQAATTTTVDVDRASIYPVDPVTLEAVAGVEPIPVGDWAWGVSSDNGSWLALSVSYDDRDMTELRLVDVENWQVATTWFPSIDTPLHVTDDGTIYVVNGAVPTSHLSRLIPGEISPELVADLPEHFFWYELHIVDRRAMVFGLVSPHDDNSGEAALVTVNLDTGLTIATALPEIELGTIGILNIASAGGVSFDAYPRVIWDDERGRMLIVSTSRDVVVEIDPTTGDVREHRFGGDDLSSTPSLDTPFEIGYRAAVLGRPNGGQLFVASAVQRYEVLDERLTSTYESSGIEAIDTDTWEVIDFLNAPISDIYLSSSGDRLLATGSSYTDTSDRQQSESSGLYVIAAPNLDVVAHHGADQPNLYYGGISVNPDMPIGYVQTWDSVVTMSVVELATGSFVGSRAGSDLQLFPEAGLLIEASSQGP